MTIFNDENPCVVFKSTPAVVGQVTAMSHFLSHARKPRGLAVIDAKKPDTGKDWQIFNLIYPYVRKWNRAIADKLLEAMKDPRITKRFYWPEKVEENFQDFVSKDTDPMTKNPTFIKAWNDIRGLLGRRKLQSLDIKSKLNIWEVFSNTKASAGSIMPGRSKEEIYDIIYAIAEWYYDNLPDDDPYPALPFARAQISGYLDDNNDLTPEKIKHKQRLVWCINASMVLVEALYARPLMDKILPKVKQYAGGKSPMYINRTLRRWKSWHWVCVDYSKYDSTVPKWIIKETFRMIKELFSDADGEVLDWIYYHFVHTKMILPSGEVRRKAKGIPSGSYFTQIVGSLVNMLMIRTYQYSLFKDKIRGMTMRSGEIAFMVMGDDNIVFTAVEMNRKKLASYLKKNFGIEMNPLKCDHGEQGADPVFLKRKWMEGGEWRNPLELLINMCTPERHRTYDTYRPIHIVFGYYLTYRMALKEIIPWNEMQKLLKNNGGVEKLLDVPGGALPGSLYAIKLTNPAYFKSLIWEMADREAKLA